MRYFAYIFVFLGTLSAGLVQAQSVTIFGGNAAHNCFINAVESAQRSSASRADIQDCDQAIAQGRLSRRDLLATYINRGIVAVNMGDISRAEKDYLTALEMSDRTPETFLNLGNLQYMMQNFSAALSDYDHAESLGIRQRHILFLNRGYALSRLGRFDEAQQQYQQALEARPGWPLVLEAMDKLEVRRADAAAAAAAAAATE